MIESPEKPSARKRVLLGLQAVVSVSMLAWIFRDSGFRSDVWKVITTGHLEWLALGAVVTGLGNVAGAFRWRIFLHVLRMPLTIRDALRLTFIGLFFNNFLPGAVGGDAVKVVWLVTKGYRDSAALVSVFMDRMSGFFALVICSLALIFSHYAWLTSTPNGATSTRLTFIFLASMAILMSLSFSLAAPGVRSHVPKWLPWREKVFKFNEDYFEFVHSWRATVKAAVISAFILFAHFFSFYCSARAFNVDVPILNFLAIMPTVDIASSMPISLGGLGVREGLFGTLLYELAQVPRDQAVSVSLGGAVLNMMWGLVGIALIPSYRQLVAKKKA